jgi:serine phosphatase RsbU (regulator of sigma subunit)/anti-sigma regulatory factor (Ser/Thr protein kinase)
MQVTLPPAVGLVGPTVERFARSLQDQGASVGAIQELRLGLAEALTNAVKHGRFDSRDAVIRLRWHWEGEWLVVEITEPGHFQAPAGWTELPADPMAESGRGGFLIAGVFEKLAHVNDGGRHTLRLGKHLGPRPPLAAVAELEKTLGAMTEDLSASYETLSALFKLAEALATTENLAEFAGHALRLRLLVEADTMHVRLRDESGALTLLAAVAPGLKFPAGIDPADEGIEATVFRTGQERTVDDMARLTLADPLAGIRGVAFVCPVYFQARQLGVCVVGRQRPGAFFTAAQISLARTTAEFLGIACANAELQSQRRAQLRLQRELEIAAQIQQSLSPTVFPLRPDWRVHGLCVNALEAGGDFFDVMDVRTGVVLVIADVMGKGVPAALLAVVLRTAVRAHAPLVGTPGELLDRVSVQIAPDLERLGMFITAQAVFLAGGSREIAYANAGHCPILGLRGAAGESRVLEEGGLPLGVSAAEQYATFRVTVAPGERLLLVTDGILEATDERGDELGPRGFLDAARRTAGHGVQAMCTELLDVIKRRDAGRPATDDRTLLVAESIS